MTTANTPATFNRAIDSFIVDLRSYGRITSDWTEIAYRRVLDHHSDDVGNQSIATTTREDVKRTLRRWAHPNTMGKNRAVMVSFYDWAMEEGHRIDNPARQTRRPRKRPAGVYRLTRAEVIAMLDAAETMRQRRVIYIGLIAGLRNAELRGLRGEQVLVRPGFIHVSGDIAKGGRERWIPVLPELEPVVAEIRQHVAADEYVIPAERWIDPGHNTRRRQLLCQPCSSQTVRLIVMDVAARAGLRVHVHPHLMRHAFGDHVARFAGLRAAQAMLGHADVSTTESVYVGQVPLDELTASVTGFSYYVPPAGRPDVGEK